MTDDTFGLRDVHRLDVRAGDTIVIKADEETPVSSWERVVTALKIWHADVHVVILPPGADIEVLRSPLPPL